MKTLSLLVVLVAGSVLPRGAIACSEPHVPTFNQSVKVASSVFIFRITSIGLTDHAKGSSSLAGRVEIVETLKGKPEFQYFTHQAFDCGRLNLQVGRYYVVATTQESSILNLVQGDKAALDITSDVLDSRPPPRGRYVTQMIRKAIAGTPLDNDLISELSARIYAFPPAPSE
jgi:hypothetical protein